MAHSNPTTTAWLLDSGASYHLPTDLSNLALHNPYTGLDELKVVDRSTASITNTGSTSNHTQSNSFKLTFVLHVPFIKQNLVFVSQL